ncbi:shikimate kinase [Luteimonas marina]|uniref:Shikimate kinase n=1 Tax=Luteimonas marina TaxID=488485 RepID=A0A5C5U3Y7_9GAMM|nr:shikimate kinase [Luteimonas marina]TWT21191.1 shikimate kinase [Luteimonas marina]
MNPAPNLVLVGPMGAGKSSIGRRLAGRFGLDFVDADREIEARTGASIPTIFECEGETGFRAREAATLAELLARDGLVVATGGGAVLDAGSRRQMRERGFVVHLQVSLARQLERLARDRSRPLLAGDDRADVLRRLTETRAPLYAEVADLCFDTNNLFPPQATEQLARLLDARWTRAAPTQTDLQGSPA